MELNTQFKREEKGEKPVMAVCYDFDKTLSPDNMQAQGYIQSVGFDVDEFWKQANDLARDNGMDENLAYMYMMVREAEGNFVINKKALEDYGSKVKLFDGVIDWFKRLKEYGETEGVEVEHYIISSGLKEMIEGTLPSKAGMFKKVYASSFFFNERGVAVWPSQVVNYTNKTQFLFRIEKGVLDVNDPSVNDFFPPEKIRVPFRNMVYIGDSATDIPCMKLISLHGGHAIGVYDPKTNDNSKVKKMLADNRIRYIAAADYNQGSELDLLLKNIISSVAANEQLENKHNSDKNL